MFSVSSSFCKEGFYVYYSNPFEGLKAIQTYDQKTELSFKNKCHKVLSDRQVLKKFSQKQKRKSVRSSQEEYHLDHIVPLSLLCSRNSKDFSIFIKSPLGRILESSINKQYLKASENLKKSDSVFLSPTLCVRASKYRNHYSVIVRILKRYLGEFLGENFDYDDFVLRDKAYRKEFGLRA